MKRLPLLALLAVLPLHQAMAAGDHRDGAKPSREDMWAGMLASQRALAVSTTFDAKGRLWRVRVEDGRVSVDRAPDAGAVFGEAIAVSEPDEVVGTEGDARPKIAVAADGAVYVTWTRLLDRPFSGDIRFSRSVDDGKTFSPPQTVNDDRQVIGHRFDSILIDEDGRVHIAWLDKRDEAAARASGESYAGSALYHAVSSDRGASFSANTKLADHACECCRIALALAPDGTPVALWRHVFEGNERDHAVMRINGKDSPHRVTHGHWRVEACPHHGPALAVDADGVYHFAWFDNGPQARGLFYARSSDRGMTVSEPLPLGDPANRPGHPAISVHGERILLAWKEFDGLSSPVRLMRSDDGGVIWSAPATVARTEDASDHPQLVARGGQAWLSWNTVAEGYRLIPLGEPAP